MNFVNHSLATHQGHQALSIIEKSELNNALSFIYDFRIWPSSKKEKSSEAVEKLALQLKTIVFRTEISHLPNFYDHYTRLAAVITKNTNSFDWSIGDLDRLSDCLAARSLSKKYRRVVTQNFIRKKYSNFLTHSFVRHQFQMWKRAFFENINRKWTDQTYVGDAKQLKKKSKKSGGSSSNGSNSFQEQYRSRIKGGNQLKSNYFLSNSGVPNDHRCYSFKHKNEGNNLALLFFDAKKVQFAQARFIQLRKFI